jgi:hypothetical protein
MISYILCTNTRSLKVKDTSMSNGIKSSTIIPHLMMSLFVRPCSLIYAVETWESIGAR